MMSTSRRGFLKLSTAAGVAAWGFASAPFASAARGPSSRAPLRILLLGGTGFIGPYMVQRALERGHTVTLFNRGRTNPNLFPEVENLTGDRESDLGALEGRTWDAVIDNSATNPRWARDSAQLLRDSVNVYLFTSTRAVYAHFRQIGMDETSTVHEVDESAVDEGRRLGYGPDKVLCEREVQRAFPGRALIVRPSLIAGPGDRSDRFTYWPARIDRGGEVLAPGDPGNPAMFIDVRDLADFYVHLLEEGTVGVFNALGPDGSSRFDELLYGIRAVTSTKVSLTWVDTDFLLQRDVEPYADMPLWRPARGVLTGFARFDLRKPIAAGLTFRPLAVTALDTLEWHKTRPAEQQARLRSGISLERESELLAQWHARRE